MGIKSVLDCAAVAEMAVDSFPEMADCRQQMDSSELEPLYHAIDSPWSEFVSEEDPRFAPLLPAGHGTVLERIDTLTANSDSYWDSAYLFALARNLPQIEGACGEIDALPLDAAYRQFVAAVSGLSGDRLHALLGRIGWGSEPPKTLAEMAQSLGVTRERMRQLQARFQKDLPSHPVFMPALDRAIAAIEEAVPVSVTECAVLLTKKGITTSPLHPANVLAIAELCGRGKPAFQLASSQKGDLVQRRSGALPVVQVCTVARRFAGALGVANLEVIAENLSLDGIRLSDKELRFILDHHTDTEFLQGNWYWLPGIPSGRNRLENVAKAMLSVAYPIPVQVIREGAKKKLRRFGIQRRRRSVPFVVAPKAVLSAFFEAHPAFAVNSDGDVRPIEHLDYRRQLSGTERIVVDAIRSTPEFIIDRDRLWEFCRERGVGSPAFNSVLSFSAVTEHVQTGVWSLKGLRLNPAAVEALRKTLAEKPREKRIVNHGWTTEGLLWVAARLPSEVSSLVVTLPSGVKNYAAGRQFLAKTEGGVSLGAVTVSENGSSWGYGPFLSNRGADEGDVLVAEFDLGAGEVTLRLTDDEAMHDDLA
jgi:hypothetical protein